MGWDDVAKLVHVAIAFALVAGLVGRWIVLRRAARSGDPVTARRLADAAGPFERMVIWSGPLILWPACSPPGRRATSGWA